jgi:hypothetical protein
MKNVTATKTWKTKSGNELTVTCSLVTEKNINVDGHLVTVPCCEKSTSVYLNGKFITSEVPTTVGFPKEINNTQVIASMGKLYLTDPTDLSAAQSVIDEIDSHPAMVAKMQASISNKKECADYDEHYARVTKMMDM